MHEQRTRLPAVIYAAKSTDDKHGSIPTQLADCRAMAEREDWEVVAECHDEGKSAYSGNRGQGLADARARAVEVAAEHGECVLVVQHSDRLARGDGLLADHLGELYFWARRNGVRLRSVQDDSNFDDVIRAVLIGERNTEDSRRKSEATKSGVRRRAEKGLYHGGPSPYGYEFVRDRNDANDRGSLVAVAAEASIVKRIYASYLAGAGMRAIAGELTAEHVPPPSARKRAMATRWDASQIANMLASPVYAGFVPAGDEPVEALHERIIDRDVWNEAQRLRAAKRRVQGGGVGREPVGRHLLVKGLLRCGMCGGAMRPRTYRNRDLEVYICSTRDGQRIGETCMMKPIERAHVDEALLAYFEEVSLDLEATRAQLTAAAQHGSDEAKARRLGAERELLLAMERIARVRRAFQDGKIDADDWRDQRLELEAEQAAAKSELARWTEREEEVARDVGMVDAGAELLVRLADLREAVAGRITGSVDVPALRAAFTAVFLSVDIVMSDDGERDLVPHVRADPTWVPTEEQVAAIREAAENGAPPPAGTFPRLRPAMMLAPENNVEITSALSAGTNALLKLGASPLTCAADVLSCFGLEHVRPRDADVDGAAAVVLDALRDAPAGADELARRTGLTAADVARALVELELLRAADAQDGVYRAC